MEAWDELMNNEQALHDPDYADYMNDVEEIARLEREIQNGSDNESVKSEKLDFDADTMKLAKALVVAMEVRDRKVKKDSGVVTTVDEDETFSLFERNVVGSFSEEVRKLLIGKDGGLFCWNPKGVLISELIKDEKKAMKDKGESGVKLALGRVMEEDMAVPSPSGYERQILRLNDKSAPSAKAYNSAVMECNVIRRQAVHVVKLIEAMVSEDMKSESAKHVLFLWKAIRVQARNASLRLRQSPLIALGASESAAALKDLEEMWPANRLYPDKVWLCVLREVRYKKLGRVSGFESKQQAVKVQRNVSTQALPQGRNQVGQAWGRGGVVSWGRGQVPSYNQSNQSFANGRGKEAQSSYRGRGRNFQQAARRW